MSWGNLPLSGPYMYICNVVWELASYVWELERQLSSKHFDRGSQLTCWVHQDMLWNMVFEKICSSFPRSLDKQTVVQCQRQNERNDCQKQAKGHQHRRCVACHQQLRHLKIILKELTIRFGMVVTESAELGNG